MDSVVSLQAEWPLFADLAGRARMADLGLIAGEGKWAMTVDVIAVKPQVDLHEAARLLSDNRISHVHPGVPIDIDRFVPILCDEKGRGWVSG